MKVTDVFNIVDKVTNILSIIKFIVYIIGLIYALYFANRILSKLDNLERNVKLIEETYSKGNRYMKEKANKDLDSLKSKVDKFKRIFK